MSRAWVAAVLIALLHAPASAAPGGLPAVTAVELSSAHPLPEDRVRAAIGELTGKPLSRDLVRQSLERLWSFGLFSAIRVNEIEGADGIRLRYEFTERALIRRISWQGRSGLDLAEVAAATGLAIGDDASAWRLAQAERDLLTRYHRDGYLAARVEIKSDAVADSAERDVTVVLNAGDQARVGNVRIQIDGGLPENPLRKSLKLCEGCVYKESLLREDERAAEERLRREGYFQARVTSRPPEWDAATNRVDLELQVTAGPRYRVEFEGRS